MRLLVSVAALAGAAVPGNAQTYEHFSVCKRSFGAMLACVVIEEGVKKVVDKTLDEWWVIWKKQGTNHTEKAPSILDQVRCGSNSNECVVTIDGKAKDVSKACVEKLTNACGYIWCNIAPASDVCQQHRDKQLLRMRKIKDPWLAERLEACEDNPSSTFCQPSAFPPSVLFPETATFDSFMKTYDQEKSIEKKTEPTDGSKR